MTIRFAELTAFACLVLAAWPTMPALSAGELPAPLKDVRFDQRLNDQLPLDLPFVDDVGRPVRLGDYFGEKPVILVLAYFECPMLCTQVLNGLVRGMLDIPFTAGHEFNVVTVSFDPRETPAMAAAKKKTYVERYGKPGAAEGWHFLTGNSESIAALTEAVGFHYKYDAARGQFAHASGILVLTPAGKISRYFYDISYPGRDLRLGLVEASAGKIGSPVEQVLLFCFHYDPAAGTYGAAVMNLVRAGGLLTVICLAIFLTRLWRNDRRRSMVSAAPMSATLVPAEER
jgi:protein SCO1